MPPSPTSTSLKDGTPSGVVCPGRACGVAPATQPLPAPEAEPPRTGNSSCTSCTKQSQQEQGPARSPWVQSLGSRRTACLALLRQQSSNCLPCIEPKRTCSLQSASLHCQAELVDLCPSTDPCTACGETHGAAPTSPASRGHAHALRRTPWAPAARQSMMPMSCCGTLSRGRNAHCAWVYPLHSAATSRPPPG